MRAVLYTTILVNLANLLVIATWLNYRVYLLFLLFSNVAMLLGSIGLIVCLWIYCFKHEHRKLALKSIRISLYCIIAILGLLYAKGNFPELHLSRIFLITFAASLAIQNITKAYAYALCAVPILLFTLLISTNATNSHFWMSCFLVCSLVQFSACVLSPYYEAKFLNHRRNKIRTTIHALVILSALSILGAFSIAILFDIDYHKDLFGLSLYPVLLAPLAILLCTTFDSSVEWKQGRLSPFVLSLINLFSIYLLTGILVH